MFWVGLQFLNNRFTKSVQLETSPILADNSGLASKGEEVLTVYTVDGREISRTELSNKETEIDISNQPAGVYFVHLQSDKKSVTEKVVIVR